MSFKREYLRQIQGVRVSIHVNGKSITSEAAKVFRELVPEVEKRLSVLWSDGKSKKQTDIPETFEHLPPAHPACPRCLQCNEPMDWNPNSEGYVCITCDLKELEERENAKELCLMCEKPLTLDEIQKNPVYPEDMWEVMKCREGSRCNACQKEVAYKILNPPPGGWFASATAPSHFLTSMTVSQVNSFISEKELQKAMSVSYEQINHPPAIAKMIKSGGLSPLGSFHPYTSAVTNLERWYMFGINYVDRGMVGTLAYGSRGAYVIILVGDWKLEGSLVELDLLMEGVGRVVHGGSPIPAGGSYKEDG